MNILSLGAGYDTLPFWLLEKLQQPLDYDLILSDLRMPALTGLEVLEFLHDLPHPPFICMTAFGDPQTHETARKLGAAATIDKPFDLDELIELVQATRLQNHEQPAISGVHS